MLYNQNDQDNWSPVSNNINIKPNIETSDDIFYISKGDKIKTSTINKSIKVLDESNNSILHFSNDEIVSFDLLNNSIYVYTSDAVPYVLRFPSNEEAEIGNSRLNDIINGQQLV